MGMKKRMAVVVLLAQVAGLYAPAAAADAGLQREVQALREEVKELRSELARPKQAYLDLRLALSQTSEGAAKRDQLERELKNRQAKLDAQQRKVQQLQQSLMQKSAAGIVKPQALQQEQQKLQQEAMQLQKMYASLQQEMAGLEKQLLEPLLPKAYSVMAEIEQEKRVTILVLPKETVPVNRHQLLLDVGAEFVSRYNKRYPMVPTPSATKKAKGKRKGK